MYHPLSPKAKSILKRIADNAKGTRFSFSESVKWADDAPSRVSPYIQELMRKGVITRIERGKYELFHGLFKDFVSSQAQ
jgi:predicted transcriptional regulator